MRKKLMICNAAVVAIGFVAAFLVAAFLMESQYRGEFNKRLDAVLSVLSTQLDEIEKAPQQMAALVGAQLDADGQPMRITILSPSGDVLGDSGKSENDAMNENHLNRPEIQQALENGRGNDMRTSTSLNMRYCYEAIYIKDRFFIRAALPTGDLDRTIMQMWWNVLLSMTLGVVLVYVVTWRLVLRAVEPISGMTRTARSLAAGDYHSRVAGDFRDEFGELAAALNTMAASTETAVSELRSKQSQLRSKQSQLEGVLQAMGDGVLAVDGEKRLLFLNQSARRLLKCPELCEGGVLEGNLLIHNVAEVVDASSKKGKVRRSELDEGLEGRKLTVYAAPIQGQNAVLLVVADVTRMRRLERLRSEFVANVTHELKTPLTSIQGSIELLKSADRDEETRAYFYDILEIETQRLRNLIDDMLVLSQIENAKEGPAEKRCNVGEVLQETADRLRAMAQQHQVAIEAEAEPDLFAACSSDRLQQLLRNLMENAVKYNRPGGLVAVSAHKQRSTVVLRVRDTGIGIASEHLSRLFERFYRVDSSRSREVGGTGLGLSIVKHLTALYGGTVGVESTPGEGSVFTIHLPMA